MTVPGDSGKEGTSDGLLGSLSDRLATPQEAGLLKELRRELRDDLSAAPQFPELVGDIRLLRTLRGFNHDLEAAARGFRAHLEIRRVHGIDAAREQVIRAWGDRLWDLRLEELPHGRVVCSYMPEVAILGRGRAGDPVSLGIWGQGRPGAFVKEVEDWRRKFTEYFVHMNEAKAILLDRASREQGRLAHFLCVLDLENWSIYANADRSWTTFCTEVTGRIGETYHDFNRVFLAIRATTWARKAYGMVKPLLPKKVTEKVWILGDDFLKSPDVAAMLEDRTSSLLRERSYYAARRRQEGSVTIRPRCSFDLQVDVPRGATLRWEFEAEGDGFREQCMLPFLLACSSRALRFSVAVSAEDGEAQGALCEGTSGHFACAEDRPRACLAVLRWENPHAVLTAKTLRYKVSVEQAPARRDGSPEGRGAKLGELLAERSWPWCVAALALTICAVTAGLAPELIGAAVLVPQRSG